MLYSLRSIGNIKSREPQRFYSYALLDPKDKPFACFRYHCLAHGALDNLVDLATATDVLL
jgi:hypothetical protein